MAFLWLCFEPLKLDECLAARRPSNVRNHPVGRNSERVSLHLISFQFYFSLPSSSCWSSFHPPFFFLNSLVNERLFTFIVIVIASPVFFMDFSHSPYFAAAPPPPSLQTAQNSNSPAPGRDSSSNLTSGTADPQAQNQSPRPLALSYPQHTPTTSALTSRAPEHRRAQNLHSITPPEKSTRTLIIDHLLWVHSVTRFAQARAELAMTDRTGGPGTSNFERRERPEQWDEDEVVTSEGEQDDVDGREIRSRSGGSAGHGDDQDKGNGPVTTSQQDLPYARTLRQRAESLENVITSMLEQPPRDIPFPPVSTLVWSRSPCH